MSVDVSRPFIVEVQYSGEEEFRRNQMTFISIESADNWGYNHLCNTGVAEDYQVVDTRTNKVVREGI